MPTPLPSPASDTARAIVEAIDAAAVASEVDAALAAIAHHADLAASDAAERAVMNAVLYTDTTSWIDIPPNWREDPYLLGLVALGVANRAGLGVEPWINRARNRFGVYQSHSARFRKGRTAAPAPARRVRWADIGVALGITAQAAQQRRRVKRGGPLGAKAVVQSALWSTLAP